MRYKVLEYRKGDFFARYSDNSASYKQAAVMSKHQQAVVIGKKARMYRNGKYVKITKPVIHRFQTEAKYAIMVMSGNLCMTHYTKDKGLRDEAWKNMVSESAKPVSPDEQLKNIIAFLEEIEDSKSGSTLKKTLKTSVSNVTPQEGLIPMLTKMNSIYEEYKHLARKGWTPGSVPSRSRLFIATVNLPDDRPFQMPGITREMEDLNRKTLVFYKTKNSRYPQAMGWSWNKRWLTPCKYAKVKNPAEIWGKTKEHSDVFSYSMKEYVGKTIRVTPKPNHPGWWVSKGYNWHKDWLEFEDSGES